MITVLISEGLLAKVLDKTLLYCQEEGSQTSTKAADLLLSLSLEAYTTDARVRMELSRAVHILSGGWADSTPPIGWLQEALFKFPWIWPTAKRANIIPLLLARVGSACHARPNTASVLYQGLREIMILSHLCQDYSYCCDVFNTPNHSLLTIVDNARLLQIDKIAGATRIGNVAQSIQFFCIDCVKFRTMPRPDDPQYGMLMSPNLGWKIETTWNWLLQTMLAIKSLPTENLGKPRVNHGTGLYTLHHLLMRGSCLTIQQRKNAWFILGREEIPDLYAHLICAQLHDTDRNAVVGMAAVLEGHTQAISRASRDQTADYQIICLSLSLLDMICPRGWIRDKEAAGDMPRWIHQRTGAGQWDFPNLMKFGTTIMSGQHLQSSTMDDWSSKATASWAPINSNVDTLLRILLQNHPLGSLSEFRKNSMISLQQRSPHGTTLTPHFFNQGDIKSGRKSRKISHLIHRATDLQLPGTPKRSEYAYPCQDPKSHPERTGTSRRPTSLNELERSTSFVLTIYTIPYPQGHAGLRREGNPSATTPFLFDKDDASPVYCLMHQIVMIAIGTIPPRPQQSTSSMPPTQRRFTRHPPA